MKCTLAIFNLFLEPGHFGYDPFKGQNKLWAMRQYQADTFHWTQNTATLQCNKKTNVEHCALNTMHFSLQILNCFLLAVLCTLPRKPVHLYRSPWVHSMNVSVSGELQGLKNGTVRAVQKMWCSAVQYNQYNTVQSVQCGKVSAAQYRHKSALHLMHFSSVI